MQWFSGKHTPHVMRVTSIYSLCTFFGIFSSNLHFVTTDGRNFNFFSLCACYSNILWLFYLIGARLKTKKIGKIKRWKRPDGETVIEVNISLDVWKYKNFSKDGLCKICLNATGKMDCQNLKDSVYKCNLSPDFAEELFVFAVLIIIIILTVTF
jgi:hypothetical protein